MTFLDDRIVERDKGFEVNIIEFSFKIIDFRLFFLQKKQFLVNNVFFRSNSCRLFGNTGC